VFLEMNVFTKIKIAVSNTNKKGRALFMCNFGLGDQIDMIGAVRYLSQFYREVNVICFPNTYSTLSDFYSDNPRIVLIVVDPKIYWARHKYLVENKIEGQYEALKYDPNDYDAVFRAGWFTFPRNDMSIDYEIPKCFYRDLKFDLTIEHSHFHIAENKNSELLHSLVKGMKYIFIQQKSSNNFTPLIRWNINETFTIDPNINLYSQGHQWHELASHFVNKPFPHYPATIIHASELHIVNSSFRCLAAHLPLEATVKKCYHRDTGEHIPEWTFNRYNPTSPSK
jgi:hypothetical protein